MNGINYEDKILPNSPKANVEEHAFSNHEFNFETSNKEKICEKCALKFDNTKFFMLHNSLVHNNQNTKQISQNVFRSVPKSISILNRTTLS